jgi:hypothetical protein
MELFALKTSNLLDKNFLQIESFYALFIFFFFKP